MFTERTDQDIERSPIGEIMHQQKLAFDGYVRMEILNTVSPGYSIMTEDVFTIASKFYTLHIQSLLETCSDNLQKDGTHEWMKMESHKLDAELFAWQMFCVELYRNNEYFIAYKILKMMINFDYNDEDRNKVNLAQFHNVLASVIADWNSETNNDKDIIEEARSAFLKAIELEPEDDGYMHDYASFFEDMEQFQSAKTHYLKAIKLNPHDVDSMVRLGHCYKALDDDEMATKYFKQAIEIAPDETDNYIEFADYLREHTKDYVSAKKYLEKAIELDPERNIPYYKLAVMNRDGIKDYKESEKYYLKCLEINDSYPGVNSSYGYLLYLMRDFEKAKLRIEIEIKRCESRNYWIYFYYALLNAAMDNDGIVDEFLQKAVKLVRTKIHYKDVMTTLPPMKENDDLNKTLYDKFQRSVSAKFKDN